MFNSSYYFALLAFYFLFTSQPVFAQAQQNLSKDIIVLPREGRSSHPCHTIEQRETRTVYYDDGQLFQEISCFQGLIDGDFRQYYPDGTLWISAQYVNGLLEGVKETYNRQGELWKEDDSVLFDRQGAILTADTFSQKTEPVLLDENSIENVKSQNPVSQRKKNLANHSDEETEEFLGSD